MKLKSRQVLNVTFAVEDSFSETLPILVVMSDLRYPPADWLFVNMLSGTVYERLPACLSDFDAVKKYHNEFHRELLPIADIELRADIADWI